MDDEDAFLYGDAGSAEAPTKPVATPVEQRHPNGQEEVDMDANDSDESDVEFILDADPSKPPPAQPTFQRPTHNKVFQAGVASSTPVAPLPASTIPKIVPEARATSPAIPFPATQQVLPALDPNLPAVLEDNTSLFDVDIETIENKAWRAPGSHLADYFNYNFDETAWKVYVSRQQAMRQDRESDKEKPFKVFADLPVNEAWATLPPELKGMMMNTIMSSMPPGMNPMAMMMGGFGGMPGMPPGMPPNMMGMMGPPPGMQPAQPGMLQTQPINDGHDNGWGEHRNKRQRLGEEGTPMDDEDDRSSQFTANQEAWGDAHGDARRGPRAMSTAGRGTKGGNPFGVLPPSIVAKSQPAHSPSIHSPNLPSGPLPTGPKAATAIPTGPKRGVGGPPPTGPRSDRNKHYKDKDAEGAARGSDLDYGDHGARSKNSKSRSSRRRRSYSDESEDDFGRSRRKRSRSRSRSYDSRDRD